MWRSRRQRRDRGLECAEIVELVTEYLEGALSPDERAQVEAHLAACAGCAQYLDQIVRTSGLLRGAADPNGGKTVTLSDDARASLIEAFRDWIPTRSDSDRLAGYWCQAGIRLSVKRSAATRGKAGQGVDG